MADVARLSDVEDRLSPLKKLKTDHQHDEAVPALLTAIPNDSSKPEKARSNGNAPIKKEYLIYYASGQDTKPGTDDDAAEAAPHNQEHNQKARVKQGGQNTSRHFGSWRDKFQLCGSRTKTPEFSPRECPFGDKCKFEHNLRKYLKEGKREDLDSFGTICPIWNVYGVCSEGWKCRWAGSHSEERTIDGKSELVLVEDKDRKATAAAQPQLETLNNIEVRHKIDLSKRKYKFSKTDRYTKSLEKGGSEGQVDKERLLPSEKRRLYFGPDTPALAPLTTQGNLPFRRLCLDFGAQLTYSEMAISMPLIQGQKSEWALLKAHQLETLPPTVTASSLPPEYDQASDIRYGVQISANKPPIACKATEVLTSLCPHIRLVDLNCGCPIDMVYQNGAGSALMNNQGRLEKIIHGMNAVSGAVPITAKIRMGTANDKPTALKLIKRLYQGGHEAQESSIGPSGVAAITLHGRSRQQRYTKSADWSYIAQCATLIRSLSDSVDATTDTAFAPDPRDLPATNGGRPWFLGNGDCYSHIDYFSHLEDAKVNAVMIGRGALIKPWIFEEIKAGQHLDVSASQRLEYVERYVKYGLETWGSDEIGVGLTRRFLLEWLSFAYRYVPTGLLERLPPNIQDRPPAYRGRNELETLLASDNHKDWIKISEMFLGPAHEDFKFEPKHKSNSYETQAEG